MYIIKNAWKSIVRNKGRNILIGTIAVVIAISACVALSIKEAAVTAKEDALSNMSVTAQITYDRSKALSQIINGNGAPDFKNSDIRNILSESLTLDDYFTYTQALSDGDSYYYQLITSLNTTDGLLPYGDDGSTSGSNDTSSSTDTNPNPSRYSGFGNQNQGDFNLTGFSSYQAMMSLFGEDGSYSITDGTMFDENTSDMVGIISDELAMWNGLSVGDSITLANPDNTSETYTLQICGIYTNDNSGSTNNSFVRTDSANNIYTSSNTLKAITDKSAANNITSLDANGNTLNTELMSQVSFNYVFNSIAGYNQFQTAVYNLGLSKNYIVSSTNLSAFENSITPLETLSTMALWFLAIVLVIGAIILIVLNIFNIRERKYEIGVLSAIGMKKHKVTSQFILELFIITFVAIVIGAIIGALISLPVTNALLQNQIAKASTTVSNIGRNFGGSPIPRSSINYISSVSSATDLIVLLELVAIGILLTIISSLVAVISIIRYEPLKILSNRG